MASNNYWLDLAEYDLETAEVMFISKRYLYVGFMCHQTIEKTLKAIYSKKYNEVPPRIHNLARLLKLNKLGDEIPDDLLEVIHQLNSLNIASRYPDEEHDISNELTQEYTNEILDNTRRLFRWLSKKM